MIIFKVDTCDATEGQKEFHYDVEIRFAGGFDDDLNALMDKFRAFCHVLGYNSALVDSIDYGEDGE